MFGLNWLKNFGGNGDAPPPAAAMPTPAPYRWAQPVDEGQAIKPQGWQQKLALALATVGDVGRGFEGETPAYIPSIQARWLKNAQSKYDGARAADASQLVQKALEGMDPADRPVMEAQLRAAPNVDEALKLIGAYQDEVRKRRTGREDFTWEQDQQKRPGQPVPNMPGYVWGEGGAIVKAQGYDQTDVALDAISGRKVQSAQSASLYASANESNANADYIRAGKGKDGASADNVRQLRGEYIKQSERTTSIANNYAQIRAVANDQSGTSDIALVYSYMKMLDPGSTVMQGEYATAENAGGIPSKVSGIYNKLLKGERLPVNLRQDFSASAGTIYKAQAQRQDQLDDYYSGLAQRAGVDPNLIIVPRRRFDEKPAPGTGNRTIDRLSGNVQPSDVAAELKRRGLN